MNDEIEDVPENQTWLYDKLDELINPRFGTVFNIVLKVMAAQFMIGIFALGIIIAIAVLIFGISLPSLLSGLRNVH